MIGSTTTFYDPALNAAAPEPEVDYNTYVQQYHQPPPQYPDYAPLFPPYPPQSFQQPPQYLPTPSVSPTSTTGRQIAPVPRQSPYYALIGAVDQHQPAAKIESTSSALDHNKNVSKRDRGAVPQRRKPAKSAPKTAGPRKRPRKSAEGTGSPGRELEESDEEEVEEREVGRDGDEPKPAQRL